jgi:hypothetical protein
LNRNKDVATLEHTFMKVAIIGIVLLIIPYVLTSISVAGPAEEVTFEHGNIFLSPYCWRVDTNGAAICPAGGGYLKFDVRGTRQLALRVDTAINYGMSQIKMPALKVIVNEPTRDGVARYFQFPANNNPNSFLQIATDLDPASTYAVRIQAVGGDETMTDGWTTPVFQTKINRIVMDGGAQILPSDLRPKRALFLGASYEQAYFGRARADAPIYTYVDASLSWPFFVAYGLCCEYGQIGIGSQGWARHGNGGYPAFPVTWDRYDAMNPKRYGADLDYVFVHIAENDNAQNDDAVQAAVAGWIPKARATFGPGTKIFIILSITQIKSAPIKAGVAAAADSNTFAIDPGNEFRRVAFAGGPTWAAPDDGIHLDAIHQGIYTAYVLQQTQSYLERSRQP